MADSSDENNDYEKIDDLERRLRVLRGDLHYIKNPEYIMRFIRARKGCVDRAFILMCNYYDVKRKFPELYQDFRPTSVKQVFESGFNYVLPTTDKEGRRIIVFKLGQWDPSKTTLIDNFRASLMAIELVLEEISTQENGVVFIVDFEGFGLNQSLNIQPNVLKMFNTILRDCYPVRVKGVHFLRQPFLFSFIYAAISPFLKPKLRSRIKIHGDDIVSLHTSISKDILPKEYGGSQPFIDPLSWTEAILAAEDEKPHLWN